MRALLFREYGPPSVLQSAEIDQPKPGHNDVLVKVECASLNPVDFKIRRGDLRLVFGNRFPRVPGVDFAGTVELTGSGISGLNPGDRVFGMCNPLNATWGSYAEYAIARAADVAPMPEGLSAEQAAGIPVAGLTAYESLKLMIKIQPGQGVLINGASGGVGTFAVQIAKHLGATVHATCSSENSQFVKELGADEVYDYRVTDVRRLDRKFQGILDAAAKFKYAHVKHLLTDNGMYVTTLPTADSVMAFATTLLLPGKKSQIVMAGMQGNVRQELSELAQLVVAQKLKPIIAKVIDLNDAPAAHEQAEKEHSRGKTIIKISRA